MTKNSLSQALQTEVDTEFLYRAVAAAEEDPEIKAMYQQLADIEALHAQSILEKAPREGLTLSLPPPSRRARWLDRIGRLLGYGMVLGVLQDTEKSISTAVARSKEKAGKPLRGDEFRHPEILQSLYRLKGEKIARIEGRHRNIGGNSLRAAVLGANDGLVSNMSLVMGVAGATDGGSEVLLTGLAGLLAGAISMALGEWISVKSSQELYERQLEIEQQEIELNPEAEFQELLLLYRAKGISDEEAQRLAEKVAADKEKMFEVLTKEELAINPDELQGSAIEAAIASFVLFAVGAIIPVIPFFWLTGTTGVVWSLALSTLGLFLIGAAITLFTGRTVWSSGLRQVFFGLVAAAVTFGIGKLIGVSLAG